MKNKRKNAETAASQYVVAHRQRHSRDRPAWSANEAHGAGKQVIFLI